MQRQFNKGKVFNNGVETTGHSYALKVNLNLNITTCTNINPKWIMNLNIRHITTELLEGNIGENLHD